MENIRYNPFSAEVLADPAAAHQELREKCPVHAFREHEPHFTSLSRHEDVLAALKNIDVFSSQWGQGPGRKPAIALFSDPPNHTKFRRLVNTSFTPRAAMVLEPMITALVEELVNSMSSQPDNKADLHDLLAMPRHGQFRWIGGRHHRRFTNGAAPGVPIGRWRGGHGAEC